MTRMLLIFSFVLFSFSLYADVPTEAFTFDTNVKLVSATSTQEDKILKAEDIIRKIIASEKFRTAVLNHSYNGKKTFVDNGGFTNEQIYSKMLAGSEILQPTRNNAMDIEVEFYTNSFTSTVGYTYPDTKRIYVNTKFFNSYTPGEVSHNLVHEWLHKLGFDHASSYSTSRDYSVPYGIGSIILKLSVDSEVMNGTSPSPLTAPTKLSLSKSGTTVTLSWSRASSGAGISSYKVYRILSGSTTAYLQTTTSSLSYTQTAPTKNAEYYVKAVDGDGKTANSLKVNFSSLVLKAVTNLSLSRSSTKVTLNWTGAVSSEGVSLYKIYRTLSGSTTSYLQGSTSTLTFAQTPPTRSAAYYVKVVDKAGNTLNSGTVSYTK